MRKEISQLLGSELAQPHRQKQSLNFSQNMAVVQIFQVAQKDHNAHIF